MKSIELHPEAEGEIRAAVAWYEAQRPGLGLDLQAAVERALQQMQQMPQMFPLYRSGDGMRKCLIRRFPYTVIFAELDDRIWVAALAHHKRKPGYWSRRTP